MPTSGDWKPSQTFTRCKICCAQAVEQIALWATDHPGIPKISQTAKTSDEKRRWGHEDIHLLCLLCEEVSWLVQGYHSMHQHYPRNFSETGMITQCERSCSGACRSNNHFLQIHRNIWKHNMWKWKFQEQLVTVNNHTSNPLVHYIPMPPEKMPANVPPPEWVGASLHWERDLESNFAGLEDRTFYGNGSEASAGGWSL